jgi:hypothetical protein
LVEQDGSFSAEWREEVLNRTWKTLESNRPAYFRLLRMRVDHPDLTSREMANQYGQQFGQAMTSDNVRKTLERAHGKFAELLVMEVASLLVDPDAAMLRDELSDLDLLKYCKQALQAWQQKNG